jgi:hypothetical protein
VWSAIPRPNRAFRFRFRFLPSNYSGRLKPEKLLVLGHLNLPTQSSYAEIERIPITPAEILQGGSGFHRTGTPGEGVIMLLVCNEYHPEAENEVGDERAYALR